MIARILWLAVLAGIAIVTAGLQLDRQARKTPAMAQSVPEIVRSSAQLPVAAGALSSDNPQYALAEAERLIRRRPMPAEHLRLLAQAQFGAGMIDESALTIQYAAQRGWRDPLAQEAILRLALEAGDEPEAARRYAALFLRAATEDALLEEMGREVLAAPGGEGRQTLITIVGGGERWHDQFLRRGARVMPPDAYVEIVRATADAGAAYDCTLLRQIEPSLTRRNADAGAQFVAVIEETCGS